jgi:hypothetical protein
MDAFEGVLASLSSLPGVKSWERLGSRVLIRWHESHGGDQSLHDIEIMVARETEKVRKRNRDAVDDDDDADGDVIGQKALCSAMKAHAMVREESVERGLSEEFKEWRKDLEELMNL